MFHTQPLVIAEPSWEIPASELTILSGKRHRYALVIPVINEGERIRQQLKVIAEFAPDLDVIVADGGSTDGSVEPENLAECGVRSLLVKRGPGRLSAQLRMAYAWVLEEGYDGVVTMDGNGKDGVEALPQFISALDAGNDYVQGSRYHKDGAAINTPLDRKFAGRLVHAPILSLAAGRWFTDTTNGFRAYSRRYLSDPRVAPFRSVFDRYNLLFYLTIRAGQLGYRSREVPVRRMYPAGGKMPTKISGLSGRFHMMGELLQCAFGGCLPPGLSPFAQHTGRSAEPPVGMPGVIATLMLLVTGLLILLSRIIPLLDPQDPWIDEAMLIANLPLTSLSAFFQPLPLFEQAAPLGYLLLANALASQFPDAMVPALRALSAVASLLAAGLIYASLRRLITGPAVCLALVFASLTPYTVIYSLEIKQYIFEYLSTALMLYLSVRQVCEYNKRNFAYFVAGGLFAIIFSFTAPIIIGAFGTGVLVQQWVSFAGGSGARRQTGTILALTLLAIASLVYYLGYTREVTEFQFAAYGNLYQRNLLTFPPDTSWLKLPNFLIGEMAYLVERYLWHLTGIKIFIQLLFAVIFLIGIVALARRFIMLPVILIAAAVLIYGLSLAEILPITHRRHWVFMVPITGTILGYGLFIGLRWLSCWAMPRQAKWLTFAGCGLVIVIVGTLGLLRSATLKSQQVSPLIDYIISHGDTNTPVWVHYGAQPAMRVLAPDTLVQLGLVSHSSSVYGWLWENMTFPDYVTKENYFDDFRRTIHGLPQLWLIFSHHWEERDGFQRYWEIAQEEIGGCRQVLEEKGAVLWKCKGN